MSSELLNKTLSINDYYQKNIHGKTLNWTPTFIFDIHALKSALFTVNFESSCGCLRMKKILILAPNGRVISSAKNKGAINFNAENCGKYTIKYWLDDACTSHFLTLLSSKYPGENIQKEDVPIDWRSIGTAIYQIKVSSDTIKSIDLTKTGPRVYSLLVPGREGTLYKGESLKEKCHERYLPARAQFK